MKLVADFHQLPATFGSDLNTVKTSVVIVDRVRLIKAQDHTAFSQLHQGGKGIATTIGALLVCSITSGWPWVIAVMACVAAVVFIYVTEFGAMGSFIAITPPAVANVIYLFLKYNTYDTQILSVNVFYRISCLIIALTCFITWLAHRKNIERMLKGEEHHTSIKTMIFNHKMKKREKARQKELERLNSNTAQHPSEETKK